MEIDVMGKRSTFERRPQDAYDTPPEAARVLFRHIPPQATYFEPCAGDGSLVQALPFNECTGFCDIEPRRSDIPKLNAFDLKKRDLQWSDLIITNPPWTRSILHPMIEHFSDIRPTWLLFDADWMHTKQAAPYLPRLRKIVSVGRVKWIPDSPHTGKDNCCWYLFDKPSDAQPKFFGRLT